MFNSDAKKSEFANVEAIKKRFLLLNRARLKRAGDCMRVTQRDFLDFLPLLFHVNHPRLPGYVTTETPSGICDYAPTTPALTAANRYINRFEYKKRAMARYDILSMFLMGSSGTVAYSKKSDFDIWLCHQPSLSADQLAQLQSKAAAIELWADGQGLEVHFFLMDAASFKQGRIVDLSSESSGTAQYYLLLEEFYRTGLLLAGRYPAWWLVPVEQEQAGDYDACLQDLYQRRIINEGECVDFGGVPTIPAEEFFGAALWQLFKGIDSPYKSVLKLLLMEVYASEHPTIELLCQRFKRSIYEGEFDLDRLDPYLMLYRRLEEYLLKRDEPERLELVRRCFYFKVNQRLSQPEPSQYDWRRELLRGMTNAWGWEIGCLVLLDDRSGWKIRQVLKERGTLVKELTYTYQFLSDFGRKHTLLSAINQHDLNALGRKLYAAFERKAGKVEIVNRGISLDVRERTLTLYQIRQAGRGGGWALLADNDSGKTNDLASMIALKRGHHVIDLLAWAYFNGLLTAATFIKVSLHDGHLRGQEVVDFIREFGRVMPAQQVLEASVEELGRAVHTEQAVLVVNLGCDVMVKHLRNGQHLASNRTDAFSYGGMLENLVKGVDIIVLNSWKEIMTYHHEGPDCVFKCLSGYFKLMPPSKGVAPPALRVLCHSSNHRNTIQQRIERLCADLVACFYGEAQANNRYIMHVDRSYYVLYFDEDTLRYQAIPSYGELLRYLGRGRQSYAQVVVDHLALQETPLPLIFTFNKPGVVRLFYKESGKLADVYVLDENGSLFHQELEFFDSESLLCHFRRFFDAVLQRQYYQLAGLVGDSGNALAVEYYHVSHDRHRSPRVVQCEASMACERHGYFNIQVIVAEDDMSRPLLTIYCEEREFSTVEYGSDLFKKLASHVVRLRHSGQRYPIFITDLDLPPTMLGDYADGRAPIVDFLNYKKNIELKLNEALKNLDGSAAASPPRPN